ncbi:MAG: cyclic nucleotide-binding domain-containing protein [Candidatus Magnetoovum sp. WYHC-5]|nr:cyclic nucleotide-binding domain-containing protein [Candidatus Magnetoovum sp. WYHC-5]
MDIIILHNSPRSTDVLRSSLKYLGHGIVQSVHRIESLLSVLEAKSFDILIADYQAIKNDDEEFFESLKKVHVKRSIRVILLTLADISPKEIKKMYKDGVNAILRYPFELNDIKKAVDDSMRNVPITLTSTVQKLSELDFFSFLDKEELLSLLRISRCRKYQKSDIIFDEGQPGDRFYVILNGTVEITKVISEQKEQSLARISRGNVIGEMAVLNDLPRSARAKAFDDVLLLEMDRNVMEGYDDIVTLKLFKKMALIFTQRLRKADAKIMELSQQARIKRTDTATKDVSTQDIKDIIED